MFFAHLLMAYFRVSCGCTFFVKSPKRGLSMAQTDLLWLHWMLCFSLSSSEPDTSGSTLDLEMLCPGLESVALHTCLLVASWSACQAWGSVNTHLADYLPQKSFKSSILQVHEYYTDVSDWVGQQGWSVPAARAEFTSAENLFCFLSQICFKDMGTCGGDPEEMSQ